MTVSTINGPKILVGESLSDSANCKTGTIIRVTMPDEWTDAYLSFLISEDNITFKPLCDNNGSPISVYPTAGTCIAVSNTFRLAGAFIKYLSGTHSRPVNQEAERIFSTILEI